MFDKFKQVGELNKLRQQAKQLQKQLEEIKHTEEKGNLKVGVTGDQKVIFIETDGEDQKELVELLNKALKEVQKKSAKKMMEMGGGLSGLLGGS
jgi:DNA-binding protein YbaB